MACYPNLEPSVKRRRYSTLLKEPRSFHSTERRKSLVQNRQCSVPLASPTVFAIFATNPSLKPSSRLTIPQTIDPAPIVIFLLDDRPSPNRRNEFEHLLLSNRRNKSFSSCRKQGSDSAGEMQETGALWRTAHF